MSEDCSMILCQARTKEPIRGKAHRGVYRPVLVFSDAAGTRKIRSVLGLLSCPGCRRSLSVRSFFGEEGEKKVLASVNEQYPDWDRPLVRMKLEWTHRSSAEARAVDEVLAKSAPPS